MRSQYFVGEDAGQVVVYRGVDGSVLGFRLSSVQDGDGATRDVVLHAHDADVALEAVKVIALLVVGGTTRSTSWACTTRSILTVTDSDNRASMDKDRRAGRPVESEAIISPSAASRPSSGS